MNSAAAGQASQNHSIMAETLDAPHNPQPELFPPSDSIPQIDGPKLTRRIKKRGTPLDVVPQNSSSPQRGIRIPNKRRNPKFLLRHGHGDVEAIAFPLGMSIAAVLSQVLERKDATTEQMSVDHLSMICTSAVRQSLANVFGDKFDSFARNFEKSFGSTLSTLRLIKNSCANGEDRCSYATTTIPLSKGDCSSRSSGIDAPYAESRMHGIETEGLSSTEEIQENQPSNSIGRELSLHGHLSRQLTHIDSNMRSYSGNQSIVSTFEKSVVEQARANDLKTFEIGLIMKKLQLKENQLALNSDSNFLERCKLSMGVSKASFKAEKFKNQLEETRHAELLKTCVDCLVAGLIIMSACLIYGAYVYSYRRISEATLSCAPPMESKSWWPMATFNSGLQTLRCQVQVISRMLFGILMILSIAYLLIQRSATPRQTMPVTFILLLLGICCGFAGKLCVDTLGGNGYHWFIYWEILCLFHFLINIFTPTFYSILYGPIEVSRVTRGSLVFPYWVRRVVFYVAVLLVLPLCCGFLPFAGPREWKDHFSSLIRNLLLVSDKGD